MMDKNAYNPFDTARAQFDKVAQLLDLDNGLVRVVKHRCLRQIRGDIARLCTSTDLSLSYSEDSLTDIWESHRLSCPKRSTLGAFLLETLPPEWFDYVDVHLATVGCHFCRASFKDLQEQQNDGEHRGTDRGKPDPNRRRGQVNQPRSARGRTHGVGHLGMLARYFVHQDSHDRHHNDRDGRPEV